jgi:hypothetical protein
MTRVTVNVFEEKDVSFLKEILDRVGLTYEVDDDQPDYQFSESEIAGFVKTKQDYLEGKTTARNWDEVKKDLHSAFSNNT